MKTTPVTPPKAALTTRLAALLYDGLIILAIEMFAAGFVIAVLEALVAAGVMDYGKYQDVSELLGTHPIWSYVYTTYLAVIWAGFLVYFWTRAGQTLGMRAWKLRVQRTDGGLITPMQALIRIGTSAFGISNLMIPFDPKKRALHDIWSKTEVVVLKQV